MCLWEWITFSSNYPEIWKLCARELLQELAWDYVFTHFKEGQIYKATVIYLWIGGTRDWAASQLFGGGSAKVWFSSLSSVLSSAWEGEQHPLSVMWAPAWAGLLFQVFMHRWYRLTPFWTRQSFWCSQDAYLRDFYSVLPYHPADTIKGW